MQVYQLKWGRRCSGASVAVRPSPGATSFPGARRFENSNASAGRAVAAPEDGRAPSAGGRAWACFRLALLLLATGLLATTAQAWQMKQAPLMTQWASQVDTNNPLPEYPRPQMV